MTELRHILLGTAGHIDHGKTSLVRRLTGIDTDRLPEEKARGISIDLGFAHWEAGGFRFGVVDVPGHERFVRNMVAGATGIDLALLVVAADDGVMPQTREHLDVMQLLGVRTGAIAVTKIDLVERDLVELVREELAELTRGTFLEGCPIVGVSSQSGEGFEQLAKTLIDVAARADWPAPLPYFRMPIDRSFSLAGHGTVVTGSVLSGAVHAGDTVELLPDLRALRVRSVQAHGRQSEDSGARQRTGINLAGIRTNEVGRGQELAAPGYLQPAQRLVVELRALSSNLGIKDRQRVLLHLGTSETPCRIILKGKPLGPGETAIAELRTAAPIVAAWGQRFLLRRISPAVTIAGGRVLDPAVPPRRRIRDLSSWGEPLQSNDEATRLGACLSRHDALPANPASLALEAAARAGVRPENLATLVEKLTLRGDLVAVGPRDRSILMHIRRRDLLAASAMRRIRQEIARNQPRRALPRSVLLTACRELSTPAVADAIVAELERTRQLATVGENIGPADMQVRLTKAQQAALSRLKETIASAGLMPPLVRELASQLAISEKELTPLLTLCLEDGLLVRIDETLYVTPQALDSARRTCERVLTEKTEATMSELREAWGITRKYSLPLCGYFDALQVTLRDGDVRRAGPNLRRADPS